MSESAGDLAAILVERSPHGILVTGPDGRIRQTNPALRQMVPMVPGPLGRTVLEAVPVPALAEAFSPGRDDEVELSFRLGARELLVQVVPLGPEAGRLAMVQDITRLRRAERYRAEFVGNVSHELRTPATAISGYAETLLEERASLDPLHAEMVEVIHRNARRLTALFDDLLTLSRLDAREGPLPLSSFRLGPVVAEAFDKCATLARDKRIHFESLVPPNLEVLANRDAMGHVVGNLVENAVKYSYEGGAVTVRAQPRDRYVLLEVIDLGLGIDPAHHQRIFERFYRVDKGRARSAGGTGLGLSIVKHLVEAMGAAIDLKSKPGSGSVFRVLLRAPVEEGREPGGG